MSSTATRTIRSSGRCPAPRGPDGGIGFPWDEGVVAMRIWQRKRQKPDMPWRCSDGKLTEPWEKWEKVWGSGTRAVAGGRFSGDQGCRRGWRPGSPRGLYQMPSRGFGGFWGSFGAR